MKTNFYGMYSEYDEYVQTQNNENSIHYLGILLGTFGALLVTGLGYYAYRIKYPLKPKFEQMI